MKNKKIRLYRRLDGKYKITIPIPESAMSLAFFLPTKLFRRKEVNLKRGGWRLLDDYRIIFTNNINESTESHVITFDGQEITLGNTVDFQMKDEKLEVSFI